MNKRQLERDARKLFKRLARYGLICDIVYKQMTGEAKYDIVKGKDVVQYNTLDTDAYMTQYSRLEITDDVLITDLKAIMLTAEFLIDPKIDDEVEYDGTVYTVISFINNPKEPSIELQLRSA